jgi:hypothetical protein
LSSHGFVGAAGKLHLAPIDAGDVLAIEVMVMALVTGRTTILLCQLDAPAFDAINCPDMLPVGTDNFHMLLHGIEISHNNLR